MSTMPRTRDEAIFLNLFDLSMEVRLEPAPLAGLEAAFVSGDMNSGSATFLARLPAGWDVQTDATQATLELFVFEGDVAAGETRVHSSGYLCVPQGGATTRLQSKGGALSLVFWNPNLPSFPPPYARVRAVESWQEPLMSRNPDNLSSTYRSLRVPDFNEQGFNGGPGGFLRLSYLAPGTTSPYQHVHHCCWEEGIMLAGDLFLADRGLFAPGSYIAFPQEFWHAVLATQTGAVMLVHTNAPMDYPWVLRDYPLAEKMCSDYLRNYRLGHSPRHTDWQNTPWIEWQERSEFREWLDAPGYEAWAGEVGLNVAWESRARWKWSL
ncbi:MAG: hypothetical protein OXG37_04900 [Actinomycetia bacterium]|nr:hypothetical protein [Actinomycetes bacterium]